MIVSVHIPKTAGTAVGRILENAFGERLAFHYADKITDPRSRGLGWRFRRGRRRPRLQGCAVVHGHFRATRFDDDENAAPVTRVTWVRDPVDRVVSHYAYWKRHPDREHSVCRAMHREDWTLLQFAREDAMRNVQALFFDGLTVTDFAFVGVREAFVACLPAFVGVLGVEDVEVASVNVNPDSPSGRYDLPHVVRNELRELNARDQALYDEAVERMNVSW